MEIQSPLRVTMLGEEGIEPSERMLVLSDPPVRSILRRSTLRMTDLTTGDQPFIFLLQALFQTELLTLHIVSGPNTGSPNKSDVGVDRRLVIYIPLPILSGISVPRSIPSKTSLQRASPSTPVSMIVFIGHFIIMLHSFHSLAHLRFR